MDRFDILIGSILLLVVNCLRVTLRKLGKCFDSLFFMIYLVDG